MFLGDNDVFHLITGWQPMLSTLIRLTKLLRFKGIEQQNTISKTVDINIENRIAPNYRCPHA
jgi:hypothetical protein